MKKKTIIMVFVITGLLCYYLYFQNTELQVSSYDIVDDNIPIAFNNYKIIHVSDFHNNKISKLNDDLVKEIKKQKPNIIVITGDLIDSRKTDIDTAIKFIKRIKDTAPIYFVAGNHEARISEYESLREKLENENVIILDNKVEALKINDDKVNLIGINDPNMLPYAYSSDSEKIQSEITDTNYDENNYSILLSHRPELFDSYVENGMNLVLTGHAHGGQVRLPFVGGLVAPNQGLFPKYTSGLFKGNDTYMVVSRGIGNSIIPFRVNNRPELVIVQLKTNNTL